MKAKNATLEAKRLKEQIEMAKTRLKKLKAEVAEGREQDKALTQKIKHISTHIWVIPMIIHKGDTGSDNGVESKLL